MCKENCDKCLKRPFADTIIEMVTWTITTSGGALIAYAIIVSEYTKMGISEIPNIVKTFGYLMGAILGLFILIYFILLICALRALGKRVKHPMQIDTTNIEVENNGNV
jgi:hypothetical protein